MPDEELLTNANENPIGSGPYKYHSHDQDRMVWERNDDWWATRRSASRVKKYIVDVVNPSNEVALGLMLSGEPRPEQQLPARHRNLVQGNFGISTYYAASRTCWRRRRRA